VYRDFEDLEEAKAWLREGVVKEHHTLGFANEFDPKAEFYYFLGKPLYEVIEEAGTAAEITIPARPGSP
jgi:hypothetical protein